MFSKTDEFEKIRKELSMLVAKHRKTRVWFWRTGFSSLTAAVLWIVMYNAASEKANVKETLAIILGAALMWILFTWAFFLLRKLHILTATIKQMERKLDILITRETTNGDAPSQT
jgi:hypothetical protein